MSPSKWYGRLLRNRALTPRHELVSRLPKLNSSELNDVVHIGSINKLSATLNGHRFGPTLRRRILDTLINRISELDLSSRKKLCSSLSISHRQDRDTIVNVLTGTRGEDLDSLKDHIDSAYHRRDWNLSDLIARITVEQKGYIVEHMRLHGTSRRLTRIFSDIDDTIVCSLKDKSLPRNTVYPGAVELFSAIGRVVFLTARPRGIRRFTISKLRYTGIDLHGAGILCGSFSKLLSHAGMAEKKLSNFLDHQRIYPCTRAVILGDSGQGDILLAKEILKNTENVPPLVLIHDVVDSTFTFKTSTEERAILKVQGVYIFNHFLEAGCIMLEHDLLSVDDLSRIYKSSKQDLSDITFGSEDQKSKFMESFSKAEAMYQITKKANSEHP